jgi:predicted phosphodiesterase
MRVAALNDVHGNLPALEAVLAQVPPDTAIVLGGDVAAGPFPAETLERLTSLGDRVHWLRGNSDRELTPGETGFAPAEVLEWVRERLTGEQIGFLYALPELLELEVDGLGNVFFCHASARNDLDVFLEDTPEEHVEPLFTGVEAGVVVCGHTHLQFDRVVAGRRIVNAGSVGMSYEDEPGAYWALLGPDIELRRTEYDTASLAAAGFPGRIGDDRPSKAEFLAMAEGVVVGR